MKLRLNPVVFRFFAVAAFGFFLTLAQGALQAQGVGEIQWLSDVEQAKRMALKQNKLVLLHFDASWCRPCKSLETFVYRSRAVRKAIAENVVPVRLDADEALELVNEFDVSKVPYDVIITPQGRIVSERRSPADAENYAKMISGTSTASRTLEKEKMGPIAHQRQIVKNLTLQGQNPTEFRAGGPETVEVGMPREGNLLQRRQTAFAEQSKAHKKSNPWVESAADQQPRPSIAKQDALSVDDLERNQFLSRERSWVAPSLETRRAKPERIINERYFESVAKKETQTHQVAESNEPGPFSLASSSAESTPVSSDGYQVSLEDSSVSELELPNASGDEPSGFGEFKVKTVGGNLSLAPATESASMLEATREAPKVDPRTFCLKGKCPVTLITEGRWADGDTRFGIIHRDRTYIFESAEKLALFKVNPDKYSPVLAGFDPVIYHEQGKLVDGVVENGVFMGKTPNQQVVLFDNAETRSKFQTSPKQYLESIRQATNHANSISSSKLLR